MTRIRAALIHLLCSVLVASLVALIFVLVWYPGPLLKAGAGDRLMTLIIAIDVVAGPLLTLLVFRPGKPGLRMDLGIIVAAQMAFLIGGSWIAMSARPAYLVFASDVFVFVPANALSDEDLAAASLERFRHRPWTGPEWVYAESPTTVEERDQMLDSALLGKPLERYPRYYRDYAENATKVAAKAHPLADLTGLTEPAERQLQKLLDGRDRAEVRFLPFVGRGLDMTTLLEAESGRIIGLLDHDPWPSLQLRWQRMQEQRQRDAEAAPPPEGEGEVEGEGGGESESEEPSGSTSHAADTTARPAPARHPASAILG